MAALLVLAAGGGVRVVLLAAATVLAGQLSIGWSNDWLDAARDRGRADKPTALGTVAPETLRTAAFVALAVTVALSLASGVAGLWQLVLVASGWLYNLRLKSTPLSAVPYAVGFAALPVYSVLLVESTVPLFLPVCGGLLGVAAHLANAAPDVEIDTATGVRGLPQRVGATGSLLAALVLLALVAAVLLSQLEASGTARALAAAVALLPPAVGIVAVSRGWPRDVVFRVVVVASLVDVVLLLTVG